MPKCWIYHETEDPQIVEQKEADNFYKAGWSDTPATFLILSDVVDMENPTEVQMVGELMDETKDRANDLLAVKTAKRKGLLNIALRYGEDFTDIDGVKPLRKAVQELVSGNGA